MQIADKIGSRAHARCRRANRMRLSLLCVAAQLLMPDWWRVDSLAPFVIVILLVKEGREASEAPGLHVAL